VIAGAWVPASDEITHDTLLRGRVKLLQPRHGFRSSLDPVLLAGFIVPPYGDFLDIGCASGALSFLLLAQDAAARGQGVEIQPRLAELAGQGAMENGFADRYHVVTGDVRVKGTVAAQAFDLVATNPPFRPVGAGVLPPLSEKAMAHHEVTLTLSEWIEVAAAALRPGGRLVTIFPYDRWEDLRGGLAAHGFFVTRSREVVPRHGEVPNRVLVEATPVEAARAEVVAQREPPLLVHEGHGFSAEVRRMVGEET
jgi:tRNA1Val (adenine37-N6)-methyltransferase